MPKLQLLPAVDVADGQAVRLVQGEAGSETSYGDPLDAALAWQRDGAEWVHLVDLDAAFGRGSNRELLARVVGELDVDVELSGGIRDDESLAAALATGCRRVNLGTAALERPEWCARAIAEHGDRIAVGLDVRGTPLAARGWTREGGELYETLARLDAEGCARYVVTDITKDGTLRGPNLDLLREVCAATAAAGRSPPAGSARWRTSARSPALTAIGVEGAIVGKALYAGAFTLPEALRGDRGGSHERLTRINAGRPWEGIVGYSRVVVRGDAAWVSGTTSTVNGVVTHPGDAAAQTRQALRDRARGSRAGRLHAQRRRPHPDVRHRHLPVGGDRPGARRGLRRHPADHVDGAGVRPDRPRDARGDRGGRGARGGR